MIDVTEARRLAQEWVSSSMQLSDDEAVIDDRWTRDESFGWIFFYNSRRFIEDGQFSDQLLGNAPIIVKRDSGEVLLTGTAQSVEVYIAEMKADGRLQVP